MLAELLAQNSSLAPYGVYGVGAARSALTVTDRRRGLWLVDGETLAVLHGWRLPDDAVGAHAIWPPDGRALASCVDTVKLLDGDGATIWSFAHPRWGPGAFGSGCAWFDDEGRAFAVVPSSDYDGCDVVHLAHDDGELLGRAGIATEPSGLHAIHQGGGWVGLSVGEGQDGSFAWWIRLRADGLEVIEAGWSDEVLFDADASGRRLLTTPHGDSDAIRIRSFPDLEVLREIQPPPGCWWDFYACFVEEHIVARAVVEEGDGGLLVAIAGDDTIVTLAQTEDPISPGPHGSWVTHTGGGIERWRLSGA